MTTFGLYSVEQPRRAAGRRPHRPARCGSCARASARSRRRSSRPCESVRLASMTSEKCVLLHRRLVRDDAADAAGADDEDLRHGAPLTSTISRRRRRRRRARDRARLRLRQPLAQTCAASGGNVLAPARRESVIRSSSCASIATTSCVERPRRAMPARACDEVAQHDQVDGRAQRIGRRPRSRCGIAATRGPA